MKDIIEKVKAGELDPLLIYIDFKRELKNLEEAIEQIQPLAIEEALKYPEKSFKFNGAFVEKKSTPATWDFKGVALYNDYKEKLKYVEGIAKIGGGHDQDGNEIQPAIKIEGKQTISIKL